MSRIIYALGRLLDAAYLDAAPTDVQRDLWKEAAAQARREFDELVENDSRKKYEKDAEDLKRVASVRPKGVL